MTFNPPPVGAIVVNYGTYIETLACMRALRTSTYPNLQIKVFDNGPVSIPHASEVSALADSYTRIKNRGFADACNRGIDWARNVGCKYVWLVNNDLIVLPATLATLVSVVDPDPQIAGAAPLITYYDNPAIAQFAGGKRQEDGSDWTPVGDWHPVSLAFQTVRQVDWVSGACMLIKMAAVRDVGLLDQRYFLYYEDVDWCIRAGKLGWTCCYVGIAQAVHMASRTVGNKQRYYGARAKFLFLALHFPRQLPAALRRHFHHRLLPNLQQRRFAQVLTDLRAMIDWLWLLPLRTGIRAPKAWQA